jgi:hypothetical protein
MTLTTVQWILQRPNYNFAYPLIAAVTLKHGALATLRRVRTRVGGTC